MKNFSELFIYLDDPNNGWEKTFLTHGHISYTYYEKEQSIPFFIEILRYVTFVYVYKRDKNDEQSILNYVDFNIHRDSRDHKNVQRLINWIKQNAEY